MNTVVISPIPAVASGDWHDKPLRWVVNGPYAEVQKFSTWKDARRYASIRRRADTQSVAIKKYVNT